jgi:cytochrome b561
MAMKDTAAGYGWISILLHWVTAVIIVVMLYLGNSIEGLLGPDREAALIKHTSIGLTAYVVLWVRIIWRFVYHHPGPLREQGRIFFLVGKWVHMTILVALVSMLISGPIMVWSMGNAIHVFDWVTIPSPLESNLALHDAALAVHGTAALVIFLGILLHIGGVYKHTAFNQDGTLTKIIVPAKPGRVDDRAR